MATLFFLTSLGLSYLFSQGGTAPTSVVDRVQTQQPAPVETTQQPIDMLPSVPESAPPATSTPPADAPPPAPAGQ
jgi:hypothetical protein